MLLGEMKVGKPIEIYIKRDGYNYRLISKIEDASKGRVCISLIASAKHVFHFQDTDEVDLVYRNDDHMWKWNKVKGSIIQLNGEMFHCLYSDLAGEPYNRRDAYRVNISESIVLFHKVVTEDVFHPTEEKSRIEHCSAMLRDISEVGVGFYSDQLFDIQSEVSFSFKTEVGDIKVRAVVVRSFESRKSNFSYYYGCRLVESSRNLSKFIFDRQRKDLQKTRERLAKL